MNLLAHTNDDFDADIDQIVLGSRGKLVGLLEVVILAKKRVVENVQKTQTVAFCRLASLYKL